jgi:IS66 Orf2 like protein
VFGIGPATRIYLALGATDMRKGFEGLYGLVRDRLQLEPLKHLMPRKKYSYSEVFGYFGGAVDEY